MKTYIVLMIGAWSSGVIDPRYDPQKSAKYSSRELKEGQKNAKRTVSSGEKASLAVETLVSEVLTSSEFSNQQRRISTSSPCTDSLPSLSPRLY